MAPDLQQYTAFMVGNLRFYEFTCMSFGLCNALAMFQHLMQNTLGELNLTYCMIYLDDIIIFGCMEVEYLNIVFERFQEFNLKLKPSKCSFFPIKNCVPGPSCLTVGYSAKPRQCMGSGRIPNA